MELKFVFIAACFGVALVSFFFCRSKRDWAWLTLGLAFTLAADYFLILRNRHVIGIAIFCFAHVAYILRVVGNKTGSMRYIFPLLIVLSAWPVFLLHAHFLMGEIALRRNGNIIAVTVLAVIYATLFITNIYLSARHLQHNRKLIVTGLLLFAACDICVMIFNLPLYFNAPVALRRVYPLIWVFYLPSQVLLAVSAVKWKRSTSDY